jgi:hypothetical protein
VKSLLMTAALVAAASAHAQPYDQPTDQDLQASYCLSVLQAMQANLQEIQRSAAPDSDVARVTANAATSLNDNIDRLRSYVLPKALASADATISFAAAGDRGRRDFSAAQADSQVAVRFRRCTDLSWLPF